MKTSKNNINTGKLLDNYLYKNKISKASVAAAINKNRVSVQKYTENVSIQTGILIDICYALKYNFLRELANALPKDFDYAEVVDGEKVTNDNMQQTLIAQLQEENKVLKIQNELLLKIKT